MIKASEIKIFIHKCLKEATLETTSKEDAEKLYMQAYGALMLGIDNFSQIQGMLLVNFWDDMSKFFKEVIDNK